MSANDKTIGAARGALVAVASLSLAALAAACGGSEGPLEPLDVVARVEVTPAEDTLYALGATRQYSAVARDITGNVVSGQTFSWSSSAPNVASVDSRGLVTAAGNGRANITASTNTKSGSGAMVVVQRTTSVAIDPDLFSLAPGEQLQLTLAATDANGNPVSAASFQWQSSNTDVVTVTATGLVTGVGEGTTAVIGSSGDVQGSATVTVLPPALVRLRRVMQDDLTYHLVDAMAPATSSSLRGVLTDVADALAEGDAVSLQQALTAARGIIAAGDPADNALHAYITLFLDFSELMTG